ncbi:MAG TPA: cupredoxin domain-containing protein [archaeon]|nr:cupredoxin domain-containing protein [archaeon]
MEQDSAAKDSVVMKKSHVLTLIGAVFMISIFIFAVQAVLVNADTPQNNRITGQAVAAPSAQAAAPSFQLQAGKQTVTVTIQGGTYYPNPIRLKKGVPAVLEVDTNSVRGCYRAIQIPVFNVRKVVSAGDNKIEFTPDKAGTFGFSCYMGMGKGQIVVEDESGVVTAVNTVAQDIPTSGSCGSGGGGCGCGG